MYTENHKSLYLPKQMNFFGYYLYMLARSSKTLCHAVLYSVSSTAVATFSYCREILANSKLFNDSNVLAWLHDTGEKIDIFDNCQLHFLLVALQFKT